MDFTQYVLLLATIAGVTELISRVRAKDWWTTVTIISAALVGAVFGLSGYYPGLDAVEGMVAGFGAAGALTAVGFVGNRSTPSPSKAVES